MKNIANADRPKSAGAMLPPRPLRRSGKVAQTACNSDRREGKSCIPTLNQTFADSRILKISKFRTFRIAGRGLINDRVECDRFWRQPFWKGVQKAPKRDEVMKAVMMVAMDTNSRPNLRKRAEKTGKVLQSFLKDEGGIEKMYRERAEPGRNTPIPDDLDLLKPDLPDPPEEDKDYNPFEAA